MTIICPDCKGNKVIHGFGCPGFKPMTLPCLRCKAEGTIPEEMLKWIEYGEKIRKAMKILERTTREEAKRRGIDVVDWSAMMFGRVNNLDKEMPR